MIDFMGCPECPHPDRTSPPSDWFVKPVWKCGCGRHWRFESKVEGPYLWTHSVIWIPVTD